MRRLAGLLIGMMLCWPMLPANAETAATRVVSDLAPRNVRFVHIDSVRGLSQDSVHEIAQDKSGYIWIATQEGLNRYDGQQILVFEHMPTDQNSLSNNWVFDLHVAADGKLWAATDGGGISIYDPDSETFGVIEHDPLDDNTISSNRVRVVFQDSPGQFWVGTVASGLNRIDIATGAVTRYQFDAQDPTSLPDDRILTLYEDRRGWLWIGTDGGGLARFDPATQSFLRYQAADDEHSLRGNRVAALEEDRDGALWVGTRDGGLHRMDTVSGRFVSFQHDYQDAKSLSDDYVRDILEDADGTLWVATDQGLNEWRPNSGGFARYYAVDSDVASLSNSRLTDLFQSSDGVLWVGSYRGVDTWNYMSDAFTHYRKSNGMLPTDVVTSLTETSDGRLWISTYDGGLTGIDRRTNTVIDVRHDADDPNSLSSDRVMVVYADANDMLWAGTRANGLNRYDPATGEILHYRAPTLSSNSVSALWGDADGTLWAGTFGGGLNRIKADGTVDWFRHDPNDPSSLGSNRVLRIMRDKQGVLWIGTEEGGLNRFDNAAETFERILHDEGDPNSISANTAWDITETSDGSMWIATLSGGLNQWRPSDRAADLRNFVKWTKQEGLRSNTVYGLLEDDLGRLWMSSNRGISRFNLKTHQLRHYDRRNGLIGDEFNQGARLRSRMGQLLFGGFEGAVSFVPGQIKNNKAVPPTVVHAYSPFGRLAVSHNHKPADAPAELHYSDKYVEFEFSALDYANPDKHRFRYMLEGFDPDWREASQSRRVPYPPLSPGNYVFRVKASNGDGVWDSQGAYLELKVLPAPWETTYAKAAYAILGLIVALALLRGYRRRRKTEIYQRELLEDEVYQRTAELDERNRELESLNNKLMQASFTDSLTELYNRRYLDQFIEQQVNSIHRESHAKAASDADYAHYQQNVLSFMMIDLDGFKAINDEHGHAAGDQALLQVRDVLLDCVRDSDIVIRWGGDEFLIVGRTLGLSGIANFAERVRFAIAEHVYQVGRGHQARMSCSIGAVPYPFAPLQGDIVNWEQALNVADACAYIVKAHGRDGWVVVNGTAKFEPQDAVQLSRGFQALRTAEKIQLTTSIIGPLNLTDVEESVA